jgi:molybdopterin-biosynthesis enzyme MoeA-like protein
MIHDDMTPAVAAAAAAGEKLKPGEAMLEQYRAAGRPIPPSLERMAAMLDKMEEDNAQVCTFAACQVLSVCTRGIGYLCIFV